MGVFSSNGLWHSVQNLNIIIHCWQCLRPRKSKNSRFTTIYIYIYFVNFMTGLKCFFNLIISHFDLVRILFWLILAHQQYALSSIAHEPKLYSLFLWTQLFQISIASSPSHLCVSLSEQKQTEKMRPHFQCDEEDEHETKL